MINYNALMRTHYRHAVYYNRRTTFCFLTQLYVQNTFIGRYLLSFKSQPIVNGLVLVVDSFLYTHMYSVYRQMSFEINQIIFERSFNRNSLTFNSDNIL